MQVCPKTLLLSSDLCRRPQTPTVSRLSQRKYEMERTFEQRNGQTDKFFSGSNDAKKQKEIVSMLFFGRTVAKKIDVNRMLTECIRGLN